MEKMRKTQNKIPGEKKKAEKISTLYTPTIHIEIIKCCS
jgi:hypothetical protein